jgi:hypothetical protein
MGPKAVTTATFNGLLVLAGAALALVVVVGSQCASTNEAIGDVPHPITCSGCVYVVTSGEGNNVNVESMSNQEEGSVGGLTPDPKNIKSASSIASVQEVLNKMAENESGLQNDGAEKP